MPRGLSAQERQLRKSRTARKRRGDKRAEAVWAGRKKGSDAVVEEVVEEAADWLERGGWRRLFMVLKVIAFVLVAVIGAAIFVILSYAN